MPRIGGRSPLLEITRAQARALEACLNRDAVGGDTYRVYVGMRHWAPCIQEAAGEIVRDGLAEVIGLCMAPHYSRMSVGAYFAEAGGGPGGVGRAPERHADTQLAHPPALSRRPGGPCPGGAGTFRPRADANPSRSFSRRTACPPWQWKGATLTRRSCRRRPLRWWRDWLCRQRPGSFASRVRAPAVRAGWARR